MFAFDLFRVIQDGVNSQILSPLSVTYALGMLNNGAAGETQEQINKVLGFGNYGADSINAFCIKMMRIAPLLDPKTKVMIANHFGDHAIYPDCRAEFIRPMSEAMRAGTYVGVEILAPYTGISKTDIALIGKRLGVDYSQTYSCYKGGELHCGKCGTCVERKQALHDAGIVDNTLYEE